MNAATLHCNQPSAMNSHLQNNLHLLEFIVRILKRLYRQWLQIKHLELTSHQLVSYQRLCTCYHSFNYFYNKYFAYYKPFPEDWKIAEVSPILKEGDFEEAGNNRPTSLLPFLSKVCEKAALNQLIPYLHCSLLQEGENSGGIKSPK